MKFQGDIFTVVMAAQHWIHKTTELYVLKGWIVLYVNYASIKLLLKKKKKDN